jgi:hypothetical protein
MIRFVIALNFGRGDCDGVNKVRRTGWNIYTATQAYRLQNARQEHGFSLNKEGDGVVNVAIRLESFEL